MQNPGTEILSAREKRILSDKLANFKGTARVAITHLEFRKGRTALDLAAHGYSLGVS
jgi:hypothetical protein